MRDDSQFPRWRHRTATLCLLAACALAGSQPARGESPAAVDRAIRYLATEVPKWHRENACYSCHNNGDAVRALAVAAGRGLLPDRETLTDTIAFLRSPARWDANGPNGPFKDVQLARLQFAAALGELTASGIVRDREALLEAAALLTELQMANGGWPSDAEGTIGSPVTYGRPLATAIALRTLRAADPSRFALQIKRGQQWLAGREPRNTLDAAAALLALADSDNETARRRCTEALALLARGESESGGWGPFVNSPPEVFDTAAAVLALDAARTARPQDQRLTAHISRGRAYLLTQQNDDGSWPATTRPPGVDSYAQQVSTTGWALQALLASDRKKTASDSSAERE